MQNLKNDTSEIIYKQKQTQTLKTNLWLPNEKEKRDKLGVSD